MSEIICRKRGCERPHADGSWFCIEHSGPHIPVPGAPRRHEGERVPTVEELSGWAANTDAWEVAERLHAALARVVELEAESQKTKCLQIEMGRGLLVEEIERLRAMVGIRDATIRLHEQADRLLPSMIPLTRHQEVVAEIERLRADEIEHLRAEINDWAKSAGDEGEEAQRLRAGLREIAALVPDASWPSVLSPEGQMARIARRLLGEEK